MDPRHDARRQNLLPERRARAYIGRMSDTPESAA